MPSHAIVPALLKIDGATGGLWSEWRQGSEGGAELWKFGFGALKFADGGERVREAIVFGAEGGDALEPRGELSDF